MDVLSDDNPQCCRLELSHTMLVLFAQRITGPPTESGFFHGVFSIFVTD